MIRRTNGFFPQTEQDWPIHDTASHISNIGRMIEEMEIKMRNLLQEVSYLLSNCYHCLILQ